MADDHVVLHSGASPEEIAYKLMKDIKLADSRKMTKEETLTLYAECLLVVKAPADRLKKK